jgi:hypothetical protein
MKICGCPREHKQKALTLVSMRSKAFSKILFLMESIRAICFVNWITKITPYFLTYQQHNIILNKNKLIIKRIMMLKGIYLLFKAVINDSKN